MVCKNGLTQYILIGLSSGVLVALVAFIMNYSTVSIIASGLITAVIIPLIIWLCYLYNKRCANDLRLEEKRTHLVKYEGWAQEDERDGWLFLTDKDIEFVPYKEGSKHLEILTGEIKNVKATPFTITIVTDEEKILFEVYRPYLWKRVIKKAAKSN